MAYQGLGDFEKAIKYAKEVLLLDPKFTQADMLISQSTKYDSNSDHYREMENKINNLELNAEQKINLNFALAKSYEDMNDIEKSFQFLKQGNKIKRNSLVYSIQNEERLFNNIKKIFKQVDFKRIDKQDNNQKNPYFYSRNA